MTFAGDDWAQGSPRDVEILDEAGRSLARHRFPQGRGRRRQLQALVAEHATGPADVAVGIETDLGLSVTSHIAACRQVYAVNPAASSRYGSATPSPGPSPTPATPRCWPA